MVPCLPINIDDLLRHRGIESARVEFKATWNEQVGDQVLRTVGAFANDLHNLNGGYLIIGVEARDGVAALPPRGLDPQVVDAAQKWIRGHCRRIDPEYQPVLSPEVVDGRVVLVVWVPASDTRPHQAPARDGKRRAFFVRLGSETVEATGEVLAALSAQTARVPFDDRRSLDTGPEKLRAALVREFLADVRSRLLDEPDDREIYRRMRLVAKANGHEFHSRNNFAKREDVPLWKVMSRKLLAVSPERGQAVRQVGSGLGLRAYVLRLTTSGRAVHAAALASRWLRLCRAEVVRNIGLLFFADDPEVWFPGARIEVAQFRDAAGGDTIEERVFRGPLPRQLIDCLAYLRNSSHVVTRKQPNRAAADRWMTFPFAALEETVANAVYHRSYEQMPEPTKVYVYPDRLEVTSYPGPLRGLELEHFTEHAQRPSVPARNRRIGELLKELRLAEQRSTGIAKVYRAMRENGSPAPAFAFDVDRTYFRVTLPAHAE